MTFQDQVKIKTVKWNLRQILEAWETQIWPLFHNIIHQVFGQIFVKIFQKSHFELYALMRWCCLGDIALSINSKSGRTGADRVNNMELCDSWWLWWRCGHAWDYWIITILHSSLASPGPSVFQEWIRILRILDLPKSNDPGVSPTVSFSLSFDDYSFLDNINEYTWFSYLLNSYA